LEEPHDYEELEAHGEEAEDTAFGADSAAGEPFGAVENGIGEVAFHEGCRCGDGEEIGFAQSKLAWRPTRTRDCRFAKGKGKENTD